MPGGSGLPGDALSRFLRVLWRPAPALVFDGESAHIHGGVIHLPPEKAGVGRQDAWHWYRAAGAHAAAHLVYSPPVIDCRGLPPVTVALLGVLEDARVETLACRELPGLRRLWLPLHQATPADGDDVASLLLRLSRALIDARYVDPHPWVAKGRRLFWADAAMSALSLCRADKLSTAASWLGNDIGQMRLQFNARGYVPGPDYRDDLRWLWPPDQDPPSEAVAARVASGLMAEPFAPRDVDSPQPAIPAGLMFPEWDHLIGRLRADWCSVTEAPAPADSQVDPAWRGGQANALRLTWPQSGVGWVPSRDGDALVIDAAIRARVACRLRAPVDLRVYRRALRGRRSTAAMVVIDQSASTADDWAGAGISLLHASGRIAASITQALQGIGIATALCGFCSNGRHAVTVNVVKDFAAPLDDRVLSALSALRSGHSTRLGAAIRHATHRLLAHSRQADRLALFVSDGQPFDVDVHDPRYLIADARHAACQARRLGVNLCCVVLDAAGLDTARQVFGARHVGMVGATTDLPATLGRMFSRERWRPRR